MTLLHCPLCLALAVLAVCRAASHLTLLSLLVEALAAEERWRTEHLGAMQIPTLILEGYRLSPLRAITAKKGSPLAPISPGSPWARVGSASRVGRGQPWAISTSAT